MKNLLLSEAIGDIAGSVYEFNPEKNRLRIRLMQEEATYTDDTVCTFAVAEALMKGEDVSQLLVEHCSKDLQRGYGSGFMKWLLNPCRRPYSSFGNGAAMRCSAAGFMARNEEECIRLATLSAECTHNHPEGIKGAVATALSIHYLMQGKGKAFVREHVLNAYYPRFKNLSYTDIYPSYGWDDSCQGTVPVALVAFLDSESYPDCLYAAIALGGDADTIAAIAGPMAYACYRTMPQALVDFAKAELPEWMLRLNDAFDAFIEDRGCLKTALSGSSDIPKGKHQTLS